MTILHQGDILAQAKIKPTIIPRDQHNVSRALISDSALKVLYRLNKAGYKAYLVGGGVRDILLEREPKDFDVVTDARPEQIRGLFNNCLLIGRRFRLAHVRFGAEIIEVSTFRKTHSSPDQDIGLSQSGQIIRDNVYGDIDADVWRRDFTINALFYNIDDFSLVDYVGGIDDLNARQLKLIGDPAQRYIEDPVRMLRIVRFSAKLGLHINPDSAQPITQYAHLLADVPTARLFEEVLKLFMAGYAVQTFEQLRHYQLFKYLFPQTEQVLNSRAEQPQKLMMQALKNMDQRLHEGVSITPAFLLAVLLWQPMRLCFADDIANGLTETEAGLSAAHHVLSKQRKSTALPRRFTDMARDIWALQIRLKHKKNPLRILSHPKFRAAYDFLELRAKAGEPLDRLVEYWTQKQIEHPSLLNKNTASKTYKRRRPRQHQNKGSTDR